jgi:hypothetical protein
MPPTRPKLRESFDRSRSSFLTVDAAVIAGLTGIDGGVSRPLEKDVVAPTSCADAIRAAGSG